MGHVGPKPAGGALQEAEVLDLSDDSNLLTEERPSL